jgi:hypothetical protein
VEGTSDRVLHQEEKEAVSGKSEGIYTHRLLKINYVPYDDPYTLDHFASPYDDPYTLDPIVGCFRDIIMRLSKAEWLSSLQLLTITLVSYLHCVYVYVKLFHVTDSNLLPK